MRVESKTVVREFKEYKYIAFDGAEFANPADCERHEDELRESELKNAVKNIQSFVCYPPKYDIDLEYYWYLVKSPEELQVIKELHFYNPEASGLEYKPDKYPTLIRVEVYDENGCGMIEDFDSILESAESYLESLQDLGGVLDDSDESEE